MMWGLLGYYNVTFTEMDHYQGPHLASGARDVYHPG